MIAHRFKPVALVLIAVLLGAFLILVMGKLIAGRPFGFVGEITRVLSPSLRAMGRALEDKRLQREGLPSAEPTSRGSSRGFHSRIRLQPGQESAFVIDWVKPLEIDAVALFPVHVEGTFPGAGTYGFPRSIRFEWFAPGAAAPVRTETVADPEPDRNRRGFPQYVSVEDTTASRLRVVVEPWQGGDSMFWALSELMIFSGSRNVAAGRQVEIGRGMRTEVPGVWFPAALTDANNPLGPPVVSDPSPSNGFLCGHTENPNEAKWMQIDLGDSMSIEEVRLFPSRPTDFADLPGTGFPVRFRIEVDDDSDFLDPVVVFSAEEEDFPNPGDSPVILPTDGATGRYVRLTATRLCPFGRGFSFSLAEMEVWSHDRNLAAGMPVDASDVFANPDYPRWKPDYLVDGYTSRNRIVPYHDWAAGLTRRRQLDGEIASLESDIQATNETIAKSAVLAGTGLLVLAGLLGMAFLRSMRARRLEAAQVREQIARDLHDDLGSNLGGIALIADSLTEARDLDEEVRAEIVEIRDVADATSQAMRGIVWLIQEGDTTLKALVLRLQETARQMLSGLKLEFEVNPKPIPERKLSIQVRRQILLAFKEALHNVRKHAASSRVRLMIQSDNAGERLTFQVQDDGCGFDSEAPASGQGLANLKMRAEALGGSLVVKTSPGTGCLVRFTGILNQ